MKKLTAGLLVAVLLAMPLTFAQAEAQTTSAINLRFRQMGEAFGEFVFNIRETFTFDQESRIELLKERNAWLKERQQAWIETKAQAMAQFESTTEQEKKGVIAAIQDEHETIIREHLRLTGDLREVQLRARASNDQQLETKAVLAAEECERSGLDLGLMLGQDRLILEGRAVTQEEAQTMVERKFGLESSEIRAETQGSATFYVVSGSETESAGAVELTKNIVVRVDAATGLITSADFSAHVEGRSDNEACVQVITRARSPETNEVRDFPTPCDVPDGWIKMGSETEADVRVGVRI